ncbi:craniofacial development protein 2-like [Plakobranchus ocellatus]|uniref:Craniofacial development protein 2-like n=1 Tax=Plakobranchus ocellatus TaxID=259542 RepID=A0AAV3ZG44_9GAST|nr:craniofacial development protein 2-like [Plakobranchus ocellatus]
MGDINAKVGDERGEDVVGPSGIGTVNERGSRLIEWCQVNDFTITNNWYQNHPRQQWTWKSPRDTSRNKIDYSLIQKRFRSAVKPSKLLPGTDCESDHVPARPNRHTTRPSDQTRQFFSGCAAHTAIRTRRSDNTVFLRMARSRRRQFLLLWLRRIKPGSIDLEGSGSIPYKKRGNLMASSIIYIPDLLKAVNHSYNIFA